MNDQVVIPPVVMPVHVLELMAGLLNVPAKDQGFAKDLCVKHGKYSGLTPKQSIYFWKFHKAATTGDTSDLTPKKTEFGEAFKPIFEMFQFAKQKLKHPKITLVTHNGQDVQLSLAGSKSSKPGCIQVTDGGGFHQNIWFGRIETNGTFVESAKVGTVGPVMTLLSALATDPIKTAHDHGKLTGRCCFCNRQLSDEKSTAAGYGPICAKNFGLTGAYKAGKNMFEAFSEQIAEQIATKTAAEAAPEAAPAPQPEADVTTEEVKAVLSAKKQSVSDQQPLF